MKPHYYLWLTEGLELLAFFVLQPVVGTVIAYKAWRGEPQNLSRCGIPCLASGVAAVVLIVFAKWLNADVRTLLYFLQVACVVLGFLLFGWCIGVRLFFHPADMALAQEHPPRLKAIWVEGRETGELDIRGEAGIR